MKTTLKYLSSYVPLVLGLGILSVAASLVPWPRVLPYLFNLPLWAWITLVVLSGVYYLGRIVRYWLMLRLLGQPAAFDKVALACLVAQPVAVLPGGELYRGAMLKRYANVSLTHGLPSVFAQSLAESIGLLVLAILGVSMLHQYVGILLVVAAITGALWSFIRWHNARTSHRLVNKLPGVNLHHHRVRSFLEKNRDLLSGRNLLVLVLASYISTFAGVAILLVAAQAFGSSLDPMQATIAYALPTILEAVSFLPGGLGIHEQGSVGILTLFGVNLPLAVALTIAVRLFTLGIGFMYGLAALGWAKLGRYTRYDN